MSNKQIDAMMRNPHLLMQYQATGNLPRLQDAPSTPLRDLIDKIPPRLRLEFKGVKLHPELGFNTSLEFCNLAQLHTWLGANKKLIRNESMPYMHWCNNHFQKTLSITDLIKHCAKVPNCKIINMLRL